jgi:hypothetical protein
VSALAAANLREHAWEKRIGLAACGVIYLGLCAQAVASAVGAGVSNSASSNPSPAAAIVLRWPGGPLLIGLCGAGFLVAGLALLIWGWVHDYSRILDRSRMTRRMFGTARATGIVGDTIRGLLVALIGIYLLASAETDSPDKVKGLDQALQALAHKPFGIWLLSIAVAGLFSFGLYSTVEARYRQL